MKLSCVLAVTGFAFVIVSWLTISVATAQITELGFAGDARFATSTMDIAQQEQVIWLEQRIKTLEQNDMQIIYMLEKILGV